MKPARHGDIDLIPAKLPKKAKEVTYVLKEKS